MVSEMWFQGLLGKGIKFAGPHICLELAIPCFRIESGKPRSQFRHLLAGEGLNLALNVLDFAHGDPRLQKV